MKDEVRAIQNGQLRIGYFADGPWAHQAFYKLVSDPTMEIVFICVRFDKPDTELVRFGQKYGIAVLTEPNINSKTFLERMKHYNVDLFVSMSFNQIFHREMIDFPPLKTINCHAGKLPFYRGRNILNWVLINDEKEFGITVHYMDEGIDTGDIILQKSFEITDEDDYGTLLKRAYQGCAEILYEAVKQIQNGSACRIPQSIIDPIGMYCGMRVQGDEILDWNQSSREIFNFVRAICKPGPQALCYVKGQPIQINKVRMIMGAHRYKGTPGQIIGKSPEGFFVKTGDSMIEITEYTTDQRLRVGDRLKSSQ